LAAKKAEKNHVVGRNVGGARSGHNGSAHVLSELTKLNPVDSNQDVLERSAASSLPAGCIPDEWASIRGSSF
jgi:hypothetical protein